jgi:alanine racemase
MKNLPLSYIEISKGNLIHNFKQFRNLVKKGTKISAVVKSNAYGHGDKEVVEILSSYVDYFQVNSVGELERIKKITRKPILVFGYVDKNDLEKVIREGCILAAFDFKYLLLINEFARRLNKKQKVHLAIDSYLGREGFMPSEIERILPEIKKMQNIAIDGIYSHFANIEDIRPDESFGRAANFSHAQKQIDEYKKVSALFKKYGFKNLKTHISATSGVLAYEKNKGINNIVRIGIGLYGLWPSEYLEKMWDKKIILKPVMQFKTKIAQVKILPQRHSIGYGLTFITKKEIKVAVIPVGYADGFPRSLSNIGEVLIGGTRCKILGRVAMNMFVVDVNHLKRVKLEDEVVLLGRQGKPARNASRSDAGGEEITAEEIAEKTDTINYEVATRFSPLLPRIIV